MKLISALSLHNGLPSGLPGQSKQRESSLKASHLGKSTCPLVPQIPLQKDTTEKAISIAKRIWCLDFIASIFLNIVKRRVLQVYKFFPKN